MINLIIISTFILLGLIVSKEFRYGVLTTIGSAIVFTPVIAYGVLYTIPYSIYMSFKEKNWKLFFKIWWKAIDGTYSFIGDVLYKGFAERYDELGNILENRLKTRSIQNRILHLEISKLPYLHQLDGTNTIKYSCTNDVTN